MIGLVVTGRGTTLSLIHYPREGIEGIDKRSIQGAQRGEPGKEE